MFDERFVRYRFRYPWVTPMSIDNPELRALVALSLVPGLGPRLTRAMIDHYGSASAARNANAEELRAIPHIGEKLSHSFAAALKSADVDAELRLAERSGVSIVGADHPEYPESLKSIDDGPQLLYVKGRILPQDANAIGIVGSRQCSVYGRKMAQHFAAGLVRAGYTVVSGLALGIDGCAHTGALDAGGRTIAVLANGLSGIYPPQHTELAERVIGQGALLTETSMAMEPQRGMFHARNRLISGLSRAVLIVEANDRSGALITARHAAEQGREVFVLPANVDSTFSAGSLKLLRDGAKLVRNIDDLLDDLRAIAPVAPIPLSTKPSATTETGSQSPSGSAPSDASGSTPTMPISLEPIPMKVWETLDEPRNLDDLTRRIGIPVAQLTQVLFQLEMKKLVQRQPGNIYRRR
jgi:DNA processing protein